MKKTAKELKKGDKIQMGGETLIVEETELSEIGKQGVQKCRIVAKRSNGESLAIVRPSDYPFNLI